MAAENTPLPDEQGHQPKRSGASELLPGSPPAHSEEMATLPPAHTAETQGFDAPPADSSAGIPADLANHPRYQIMRLLGQGGMGAVYQAMHRVMERPVALKMMRSDLTGNSALAERFRREVKAAAQLHHPNIVAAYDAEQAGSTHFLVMEYVAGKNLADVVQETGPLPVAQAVDYMRQAALGLQHAFTKGMIHRDIKPHNLILTKDVPADDAAEYPYGLVKILDFGLARFTGAEAVQAQTASGLILGTVDFMAPEQADNARSADIRSDIYSLGCTLYYLLAGRVPFPEGTLVQRVMAHVTQEPPPIAKLRPGLPAGLIAVLNRMLAKDPAKRFQTPAEVAEALSRCTQTATIAAPTSADMLEVVPVLEAETALPKATPKPSKTKPKPLPAAPPRRKSRVLLGCFLLTLATIISFTFLGYYFVRTVIDRVGTWIEKRADELKVETNAWDHLDKTFVPPVQSLEFANDGPEANRLFPAKIKNYQRQTIDKNTKLAALDFDAEGDHATYVAGNQQMHLSVCPMNKDKKEAMYGRILLKLQQLQQQKQQDISKLRIAHYEGSPTTALLRFQIPHLPNTEPVSLKGAFWWHDGWLFFLRTVEDDPVPLLQSYLQDISSSSPAPAKGTAKTKK